MSRADWVLVTLLAIVFSVMAYKDGRPEAFVLLGMLAWVAAYDLIVRRGARR